VLVLLLVLVISLIAVLAFLILPLTLHGSRQSPIPLLYFVAVGLGYILVEIAFIQALRTFPGTSDLCPDRGHISPDAVERCRELVIAPLASSDRAGLDATCTGDHGADGRRISFARGSGSVV